MGYIQILDLITLNDSKPQPAVIHPISKPMAHTLNISAMCVLKHKAGQMIMSASKDASIRIWKPHPELGLQVAGEMTGHARKITSMVQFGQKVYTSSEDHSVNVWDATNGNLVNSTRVQKGENHKQSVNCVVPYTCRAQSNATFVITASYDNTIRVWKADTMAHVHKVVTRNTVVAMKVVQAPNGKDALICGNKDGSLVAYRLPELKFMGLFNTKGNNRGSQKGGGNGRLTDLALVHNFIFKADTAGRVTVVEFDLSSLS